LSSAKVIEKSGVFAKIMGNWGILAEPDFSVGRYDEYGVLKSMSVNPNGDNGISKTLL
jgi:hypothetical protein